MASKDLITLSELKSYLGISGSSNDGRLSAIITGVSHAIEAYTQKFLVQREGITEDHTGGVNGRLGGAKRIYLKNYPIQAVSGIKDDDGTTIASGDYTVVADQGILEHDTNWPAPNGRWTVTYKGGRFENTDSVDEDFKMAAKVLASTLFSRPDPSVSEKQIGDLRIRYRDLSVQNLKFDPLVRAILEKHRSRGV